MDIDGVAASLNPLGIFIGIEYVFAPEIDVPETIGISPTDLDLSTAKVLAR